MNRIAYSHKHLLIFGIPLLMLGVLILLIKSPFFDRGVALNLGITLDLVLTIPLVYFLLIRKTSIPATTVLPVMIVGVVVGSYFLPKESQTYLSMFKTWALPVIELSILSLVIFRIREAIKRFKGSESSTVDFFTVLKEACHDILPRRLVQPFATEVAVFYYGFVRWKSRVARANEFTYHKKSGTQALLFALILIIAVETIALHFIFARWSSTAAWIISALSIYTAIQIVGFSRSLAQRPISVNENSITLRYGILSEVVIPIHDIERIELSRKSLEKGTSTQKLSPLGELESHNVILHLNTENELTGFYGMKKRFTTLAFFIDEPEAFKKRIADALGH